MTGPMIHTDPSVTSDVEAHEVQTPQADPLEAMRRQFVRVLVPLAWINAALIAASVIFITDEAPLYLVGVAAALALAVTLSWMRYGVSQITRDLSAVTIMGQVAFLVMAFQGHPY